MAISEKGTEAIPPGMERIRAILREHRDEIARDYGVGEIGVFGSCVREESSPGSDIDILVTFEKPIGFFGFLELEEKLGAWLGAKVDLVTKGALKPGIGKQILREVVML